MSRRAFDGAGVRRSGLLAVEVAFLYTSSALVGGTGLVYAWYRYFATPVDPFAVVASSWQPLVQHLHVLLAPLLVFASGAVWRSHVWASWRKNGSMRRRSGISLALSIVPMVASGYLVQVAQEESWRHAWGIIHTTVSVAWVAGSLIHFLARRPRARADAREQARVLAGTEAARRAADPQNATRIPN